MSLQLLREHVFRANIELVERGLVVLTWGNASGIDRDSGLVVIKPSGVDYAKMTPRHMVVVDLEGNVVEGDLRPSSDTPTHLELYRAWPDIGGVVHTHSTYGTAFAQAGLPIPCYGTTQADYCPGDIPCIRSLNRVEVEDDYEGNTGRAIVEHYREHDLKPQEYPGAVLHHHGPFAWGKDVLAAAESAVILENVAWMAMLTTALNPEAREVPSFILNKHFQRKHGPNAYYGQK